MDFFGSRRARGRWAALAVALWLPTVLGGIWLIGSERREAAEAVADDPRLPLDLDPVERATMLRAMRVNLEALDGVMQAWARGDRAGIAAAATRAADEHPAMEVPSLREVLPPEWRAMGGVTDAGWAALAADAASLPEAELAGRIAGITAPCVACHQRYRFR